MPCAVRIWVSWIGSFCAECSRHEGAGRGKMADIRDNLDLTRLSEFTERDVARLTKYTLALRVLQDG